VRGSVARQSNFDFLLPKWTAFHAEAKRVERDTLFDRLSAWIFGRRTIEVTIAWMYRADKSLVEPYKDDLNARIAAPAFKALVGQTIYTKMDLIRQLGNRAAHEGTKPPSGADALGVTLDLFHIMFWIMFWIATAATGELEDFVAGRTFSGNQLEFVNLVIEYLTRHGDMDPGQLYDPPCTDVASTGPNSFSE